MKFPILTTLGVAAALCASPAFAVGLTETFDTNPILAENQAPGVWYEDRYAPAGFSSTFFAGDNRLELELSQADSTDNRPPSFSSAFYDTQGRKFDTPGATMLEIDFYIDAGFATLDQRIGGIWGTATTPGGDVFPILEFFGGEFQVYDTAGTFSFVPVGTPTGFAYDQFATLKISLDTIDDEFDYFVDDELLGSFAAGGATEILNVILQGVNRGEPGSENAGVNRSLYFDNLEVSGGATVPLPAPAALLLTGLAGLGLLRRRAA
ncbi:hypothetical protein LNKW23_27800 [Paralimibaculum aggregatum]|uniref:PEP-CTERM sorting domain-containing protein n=1 Tax=Paralimibaculum aggregatum TaxID=3036245 RepID=A0ABQ6LJY0_9RHOB|nr:hypothetical protein [Limibaculum sp. NKW23]GMG83567.1 hypothetical protein LNKW23_27800 [Limibaculum sp. NKW23]